MRLKLAGPQVIVENSFKLKSDYEANVMRYV